MINTNTANTPCRNLSIYDAVHKNGISLIHGDSLQALKMLWQ